MLIERHLSDIFENEKIEDTFEKREDGEKNIGGEMKKSIIEGSINLQISIANSISANQNMKERGIVVEDEPFLEDSTFSLKLLKSISKDEQVEVYKKFFDSLLLISESNGSVFQVIGRSKRAKEYFYELLKKGKIDKSVLKYVLGDESGKLSKFENSKDIKYNVPYEFFPDLKTDLDIYQNKFLSTVIDYVDNPLEGGSTGFLTKLNINYLEKDENMVALSKKVDKLFFIEYDVFKNCFVTWKKIFRVS